MERGELHLRDLFDSFGVSSYHSKGIRGQGVRILVVDTGMDDGGENTHGLAVRSLIQAPHNSHGLVGIAPDAKLDLVDVHDASSIPIDLLLAAMRKGIEAGTDIMSISLGTNDSYDPLQDVINEAAAKGVLVFAAAGNSGSRAYEYPASCFKAIGVASVNQARQLSGFNTRNDAVAVFAPGEKLWLPGPGGELKEYSGTSFATPFAAGLAALVLSARRRELGDKSFRMSRREMIDTLRDANHLHLNCDTHTYVMDKTCTTYGTESSQLPSSASSASLTPWLFLLLVVFVLGSITLLWPMREKLNLL